jgi:hypothetical protein
MRGAVCAAVAESCVAVFPAAAQTTSSFVPITPCRMIDTRAASSFPSPYGAPAFGTAERRVYTIDGPLSGEDRG